MLENTKEGVYIPELAVIDTVQTAVQLRLDDVFDGFVFGFGLLFC